jgi:glutathione S-transferase
MIRLYQYEISPFCDKIRRVLHVKGQRYDVRDVSPSETLGSYKKINPLGKVPCLEIDGSFHADSTDIAHELEARFPEPPLLPQDPEQRALCHILEDWADESLYFYEMRLRFTFGDNARHWIARLAAGENPVMRALAPVIVPRVIWSKLKGQGLGLKPEAIVLRDLERHLGALGGWLGNREWLVGERLTLADIAVYVQLACIQGAPEGAARLEQRPELLVWMERVDRATAPRG